MSTDEDWRLFAAEIMKHGCSHKVIEEEFWFVNKWLEVNPIGDAQRLKTKPMISAAVDLESRVQPPLLVVPPFLGQYHKNETTSCAIRSVSPFHNANGTVEGMIKHIPAQTMKNSVRKNPVRSTIASSQSSRSASAVVQSLHTPIMPYLSSAPDSGPIVRTRAEPDTGVIVRSPSTLDKGLILQSSAQIFNDGLIVQNPFTVQEAKANELIPASNEFEEYVQVAIGAEVCRLLVKRDVHPGAVPQPYFWFPKDLQAHYKDSEFQNSIPSMDSKSFSVRAYEAAPKCGTEIQRLRHILMVSDATWTMGSNDGDVSNVWIPGDNASPTSNVSVLTTPGFLR